MLRSIELQSIATQVRQELALAITGLEESLYVVPCDYENLETHAFGAVSVMKTNIERMKGLENALGEFPSPDDTEGVA